MKAGKFQFECPKCKSLLEVSASKKKFRCPTCKAAYGVNFLIEDHKEHVEKKDVNNRTLKEQLTILSKFERELRLDKSSPDMECDRHEYSDVCSHVVEVICLQCKKRLCNTCNDNAHQHPDLRDHSPLPQKLFYQVKDMFIKLTPPDKLHTQTRIECMSLVSAMKDTFKDRSVRHQVKQMVYSAIDQFGKRYGMSFEEFVQELAYWLTRQDRISPSAGSMANLRQHFSENTVQEEVADWQSLSRFGKFLYDLHLKFSKVRNDRSGFVWGWHFVMIEAKKGIQITAFFYILRYLFLLQLLISLIWLSTIFMPHISWSIEYPEEVDWKGKGYEGIITGYGMQDSIMFYSGYLPYYFNHTYNMKLAWVIVLALSLFVALNAAVNHQEVAHKAVQQENAKIAFASIVLGAMDHRNAAVRGQPVKIRRKMVLTSLETLLHELELNQRTKKMQKQYQCYGVLRANTILWSRLFCLAIVAGALFVLYLLITWEMSRLPAQWRSSFKFLIVPFVMAGLKITMPDLIRFLMYFEDLHRRDFVKHLFWRVVVLRLATVLVISLAVVEGDFQHSRVLCAEAEAGILFWRVFLVDFFVELIVNGLVPFAFIWLARRIANWYDPLAVEDDARVWEQYDAAVETVGAGLRHRKTVLRPSKAQAQEAAAAASAKENNNNLELAASASAKENFNNVELAERNRVASQSFISDRSLLNGVENALISAPLLPGLRPPSTFDLMESPRESPDISPKESPQKDQKEGKNDPVQFPPPPPPPPPPLLPGPPQLKIELNDQVVEGHEEEKSPGQGPNEVGGGGSHSRIPSYGDRRISEVLLDPDQDHLIQQDEKKQQPVRRKKTRSSSMDAKVDHLPLTNGNQGRPRRSTTESLYEPVDHHGKHQGRPRRSTTESLYEPGTRKRGRSASMSDFLDPSHSRDPSDISLNRPGEEWENYVWAASRERQLSHVKAEQKVVDEKGKRESADEQGYYHPLRRAETSYEKEYQHQTRYKKKFDLSLNLANVIYMCALIYCGAAFCPALPVFAPVYFWVLFHMKRVEVLYFTKRARVVTSSSRQGRFFRVSFIVMILVAMVPFNLFLRIAPACGPHANSANQRISEVLAAELVHLPIWLNHVVDYLTSVVLLWMMLFLGMICVATYKKRDWYVKQEMDQARLQLKLEAAERKKIIEVYQVQVGRAEARGKELFVEWSSTLPDVLADRYCSRLTEIGYGDMIKLCSLSEAQLEGVLDRIHAKGAVRDTILIELAYKRKEMIYQAARGI